MTRSNRLTAPAGLACECWVAFDGSPSVPCTNRAAFVVDGRPMCAACDYRANPEARPSLEPFLAPSERAALTQRAERAEHERDELRAECDRLRVLLGFVPKSEHNPPTVADFDAIFTGSKP